MRKITVLVLVALLVGMGSVGAIEEDRLRSGRPVNLLSYVANHLSGATWLRLTGLDPRETLDRFALYAPQASTPSQGAIRLPFREPTQRFSRNVLVTFDIGRIPFQNEPSIAVNPTNPENVVVASHDYDTFCLVAYNSIDGGGVWNGPFSTKPLHRDDFCSDPVLAFDRPGRAFASYLSIGTRIVAAGRLIALATVSSVVISRSDDGGSTWGEPVIAARGDAVSTIDSITLIFPDKPWITIGPSKADTNKDSIYITYTEFALRFPIMEQFPFFGAPLEDVTIKLVRSTDGGLTFSAPISVSPTYSYLPTEDRPIVQGSMPAVGPDGTVYVSYYDSIEDGPWKGLYAPSVVSSTDGGRFFSKPSVIEFVPELDFTLRPTIFRAWSSMFPIIGTGPEGNVYVVFAVNPAGPDDSDVMFSSSTDRGKTWSKPKRVNDDSTTRDQFFPFIAVSKNGTIHIIWGDMRDDPDDIRYHIYYTRSGDQGRTFIPNSRVTDFPSNPSFGISIFVGDYFFMAVSDRDVHIAWTDSRLGVRGLSNQDIGVARQEFIKSPAIFISPPTGPAGSTVTIQGFNFGTRGRDVFILLDDVLIASALTDENGRFVTKIFIPISGSGSHIVRAIDESGNAAELSFFTSFGFDNIQQDFQKTLPDLAKRLGSVEGALRSADPAALRTELQKALSAFESDVVGGVRSLNERLDILTIGLLLVAVVSILSLVRSFRPDLLGKKT